MRRLLIVVMALLVAVLAGAPVEAQQAGSRIDVSKLGPQVGERVPDFKLTDQNGREQTLQSIMGPRGAMLVFVRSADWCPFCRTQLVDLQGRVEELRRAGLGVAVISYDSREILADFARRQNITYLLLSDVGSATIKRYGILNTVAEAALAPGGADPAVIANLQRYVSGGQPSERWRGMPFPGTFMLDRQGRVTSRFFEDFYWERSTASNILLRVGAATAPVEGLEASTQHLDLKAYPSDPAVSLGTRFSLVVDIRPKPGMHVYAPGASGYRIVNLAIEPQPHVRTTAVKYPSSEIYHFVPLNERVQVYQKPFTLMMDVVADATADARRAFTGQTELMVRGSLEYQACDDKICYNPVSLPLSWKVSLRPNVAGATRPAAPGR